MRSLECSDAVEAPTRHLDVENSFQLLQHKAIEIIDWISVTINFSGWNVRHCWSVAFLPALERYTMASSSWHCTPLTRAWRGFMFDDHFTNTTLWFVSRCDGNTLTRERREKSSLSKNRFYFTQFSPTDAVCLDKMQAQIEFRLKKSVHNFLLSMKLIIARRHERKVQILFSFSFTKILSKKQAKLYEYRCGFMKIYRRWTFLFLILFPFYNFAFLNSLKQKPIGNCGWNMNQTFKHWRKLFSEHEKCKNM